MAGDIGLVFAPNSWSGAHVGCCVRSTRSMPAGTGCSLAVVFASVNSGAKEGLVIALLGDIVQTVWVFLGALWQLIWGTHAWHMQLKFGNGGSGLCWTE